MDPVYSTVTDEMLFCIDTGIYNSWHSIFVIQYSIENYIYART